MKTLVTLLALTLSFSAFAQQETRVETIQQTIKYDPNGPDGRQLISVERQVVTTGHTDKNTGRFVKSGQVNRSVATMIPLDK